MQSRTASGIPPAVWQFDAASLSDANKGLPSCRVNSARTERGMRMVGRAVTVIASADLVPVLTGLQQCGAGDILVVDAGTTEQAVVGELFATEAVRRGMAGIVVYGLCRDTATLISCRCRSTPSARFPALRKQLSFRSPSSPFAWETSTSDLARFWSATMTASWS